MKFGFDETFEEYKETSNRLIDFTVELSAIEMEPLVPRAGSTAADQRSMSLDIDAVSSEMFNDDWPKLVMKTDTVLVEEHEALLQTFRELKGQQKFARTGDTWLLGVNEPLLELENKTESAHLETVSADLQTLSTTSDKLGVSGDRELLRASAPPGGDWSVHSIARLDHSESRILRRALMLDKTLVNRLWRLSIATF